jgi:hypothetical protein
MKEKIASTTSADSRVRMGREIASFMSSQAMLLHVLGDNFLAFGVLTDYTVSCLCEVFPCHSSAMAFMALNRSDQVIKPFALVAISGILDSF